MSDNPYTTPQSSPEPIQDIGFQTSIELASRWARLGAAIIDIIILMALILLIEFIMAFVGLSSISSWEYLTEENHTYVFYDFIWGVVSVMIYIVTNSYFLVKSGQTIGKIALCIKVVDYHTNQLLSPAKIIGIRYGVAQLIGVTPKIGDWFSLVNVLFIFGREKRCIHDLMANSKVIKKAL